MGEVGGSRIGVEEEVGAGAGGGDPGPCRPAEILGRDGQQRIGDRDALEPEASTQLTGRDRAGEGGGPVREGGEDRRGQHHHVAAGVDEAPVGRLVDAPQRRLRALDRLDRVVGVGAGGAVRREVLRGGGDPRFLQPLGERDRGRLDGGGGRAEAAFVVGDVPPGSGEFEHRREIDVDPDVAQVPRGLPALCAAEGRAPFSHHPGRHIRGAADPLHQPALLVDHHQQRVAQPAAGAGSAAGPRSASGRRLGSGRLPA